MLKVSATPAEDVIKGPKHTEVFVKFLASFKEKNKDKATNNLKKRIKETVMHFGVVMECAPLPSSGGWWRVKFSNVNEAKRAMEMLLKIEVQATFDYPLQSNTEKNAEDQLITPSPDQRALCQTKISDKKRKRQKEKKTNCFSHFMKHPKTICWIPSFFWNVLAVLAVISLPVITYTLVDILDIDVYRVGCLLLLLTTDWF